jgi:hypothetical protein
VNKSAVKSCVTQQLEFFALRSLELADQPARYTRQAIDWGLTGNQLVDAWGRHGYLAVRRLQLTWRVIGFAEALALRSGNLRR